MSERAKAMVELVERGSWDDLDPAERALFDYWLSEIIRRPDGTREEHRATGADLFLLMRFALRRWMPNTKTPRKPSSSQTLQAILETEAKPEPDDPPDRP